MQVGDSNLGMELSLEFTMTNEKWKMIYGNLVFWAVPLSTFR
jgi:hypothetical protein